MTKKSYNNAFMANTRELTVSTVAEAQALTFPNDGGDFWVRIEERGGAKFKTSATGSGDGFSSLLRDDGGYLELDESGVVTPEMFGAVGSGDESAVFNAIPSGSVVDLSGGTYSVVSQWVDPVNGANLASDYQNGTLIVDGRESVYEKTKSFAASASEPRPTPSASKSIGIQKLGADSFDVWKPLGGPMWARCRLGRSASGIPFNWQETALEQVYGYIAAQDAGVTYTGGWATTNGTTAQRSADPDFYVSGRARQSITPGDYVEITYTGGGNLYVVFVGRTSGNFVNVLLNGGQDYLTLPDDGSGNRYFDSYTPDDLSYKQVVQIAAGLPSGTHTIRLTVSATRNASSTGDRFLFNALSFEDSAVTPWNPLTDALQWQTGESVLQDQVRKSFGRYYYAAADGTTGATAPSHASGSVSDGSVTWVQRDESGYKLNTHTIQKAGSQLEYAYEIQPDGATASEDVGGALHGNETQNSYYISVDGSRVSLIDLAWASGDAINFVESISATHSEIGGGSTEVVATTLQRIFTRETVRVKHEHTLQVAAEVGYFYSAMWPLLHYGVPEFKYGVRQVFSPSDGYRDVSDFYGITNPFVGRTRDLFMSAKGDAFGQNGSGGVPAVTPAPMTLEVWLAVTPESVNYYREGNRLFASKAMNTSGGDASSGGYSSLVSKLYFERHSALNPVSYTAGDVIRCEADYGIVVY